MNSVTPRSVPAVDSQKTKVQDQTVRFDSAVAKAASEWFVLLASGASTAEERRALQAWLSSDSRHATAWEHIQSVNARFGVIPSKLGFRALGEPRSQSRRKSLQAMVVLIASGAAGSLTYRQMPWEDWTAEYRTATGETKDFTLLDGTRLILNTASSLDILYTETQRVIRLHAGEVLVSTGHLPRVDGRVENRPFMVHTHDGHVRAIGTRFTVMKSAEQSAVAVYEGAVEITPEDASVQAKVFAAGQAASFSQHHIVRESNSDERAIAWTEGLVVADGSYLADFVEELNRHRPGVLRCDPRIATLRVSGVFRLNDPEGTLASVADALPVKLKYRTRYWVSIEPA